MATSPKIEGVTPAPLPDSARGGASVEKVRTIPQGPDRPSTVTGWPARPMDDPSRFISTPDPTWPADRTGHPSSVIPGDPTPRPYHPEPDANATPRPKLFDR